MINYLSGEDILVLHSDVIDATGGLHGVREVGLLASIVEKPRSAFGGKDLYPDIFTKTAVYLESIANYHVFIDGNKRTSILVSARFLYINGFVLTATNRAVEQFVLRVARDKITLDQIPSWFKSHSKKIKKYTK